MQGWRRVWWGSSYPKGSIGGTDKRRNVASRQVAGPDCWREAGDGRRQRSGCFFVFPEKQKQRDKEEGKDGARSARMAEEQHGW